MKRLELIQLRLKEKKRVMSTKIIIMDKRTLNNNNNHVSIIHH